MKLTIDRLTHRPTIGFLARDLFDGYEGPIWRSVLQAGATYDFNLISYSHEHSIFNLVNTEQLDGVILVAGTIVWDRIKDSIEEFTNRFSSIPVVSVGRIFPDFSSLLIDDESGIRQIIEHLITVHHCRRIAFIRGANFSVEAQFRYKTYQDVLSEYGIPYDEKLVCDGNFSPDDGTRAIQTLVKKRKVKFDAVIASNDYMAIAAMKELIRLGYDVPGDVAVTGFDDIQESQAAVPSLTTVRQPLYEIGRQSVEMINVLMQGDSPQSIVLPTCPVFRASCGCSIRSEAVHSVPYGFKALDNYGSSISVVDAIMKQAIAQQLNLNYPEVQKKLGEQWAETLLEPLRSIIIGEKEPFLNALGDLILKGYDLGLNTVIWYSIIRSLETVISPLLQQEPSKSVLNEFVKDAFEQIGLITIHKQTVQQIRHERQLEIITYMFMVFNSKFDAQQLIESYIRHFPELKVKSYYLSRYEDEDKQKAKIVNCFSLNRNVVMEDEHSPFPAKNLIPGRFSKNGERSSYIVLPIMQVGFVLFEIDNMGYHNVALLIGQIGMMVRMAGLMDTVLHYVNDLEEKVDTRTKKLKEAQQQLLETAHQAGMAEIAIGVLHNVGNLLNSIGISTEVISELTRDSKLDSLLKANELIKKHRDNLGAFFSHDSKAKMLPDFYDLIAKDFQKRQELIDHETNELIKTVSLTKEIVEILQDYAHGDRDFLFEEKNDIATIIEDALKIQESKITKDQIKIVKDYRKIQPVLIQKTKLTHVIVNIIKNAIEAMQNQPLEERRLTIRLFVNGENQPVVEISDTGVGIEKEDLKKIFHYGFTTKKDGHGFGLHTCANYMREMHGSIRVQSRGCNRGAKFSLIFSKIRV